MNSGRPDLALSLCPWKSPPQIRLELNPHLRSQDQCLELGHPLITFGNCRPGGWITLSAVAVSGLYFWRKSREKRSSRLSYGPWRGYRGPCQTSLPSATKRKSRISACCRRYAFSKPVPLHSRPSLDRFLGGLVWRVHSTNGLWNSSLLTRMRTLCTLLWSIWP